MDSGIKFAVLTAPPDAGAIPPGLSGLWREIWRTSLKKLPYDNL